MSSQRYVRYKGAIKKNSSQFLWQSKERKRPVKCGNSQKDMDRNRSIFRGDQHPFAKFKKRLWIQVSELNWGHGSPESFCRVHFVPRAPNWVVVKTLWGQIYRPRWIDVRSQIINSTKQGVSSSAAKVLKCFNLPTFSTKQSRIQEQCWKSEAWNWPSAFTFHYKTPEEEKILYTNYHCSRLFLPWDICKLPWIFAIWKC